MSARRLVIDAETSPHKVWTWGLRKQEISLPQIIEPSRMLSFAAKWYGEKKIEFWSEFHNGRDEMIGRLWKLMDEADIVVHFNGKSFDVPVFDREFWLAGLAPYSPIKQVDLYLASKRFRFASHKLDHIVQQKGIGAKVNHAGFSLWRDCLAGNEKAWAMMKKYNIGDVKVTDALYEEMLPWLPTHPHLGLYELDPESNRCGRCLSEDLQWRGFAVTDLSTFRRYVCKSCGRWGRAKIRETGVDARPVA